MFSRKWLLTTLLVLAAGAVLIRLGFWQLDRLAQRRAFNAVTLAEREAPTLVLDADALDLDLEAMVYREVLAVGEFVFDQEIALRNQVYAGRPAYRLLTPLRLRGTDVLVLVDRGLVPADAYSPGDHATYAHPVGEVEVHGVFRASQEQADIGSRDDPETAPGEILSVWNLANLGRIAMQLDAPLLPVYIQQGEVGVTAPETTEFPVPEVFIPELTEGPHLGYAIQWFIFAAILLLGYPLFLRRERGAVHDIPR